MNRLIVVIFLVIPSLALAGDFACFDAGNTVTNRVVSKVKSQGKAYSIRADCVRITREQYSTITNRYKVVAGEVVTMSNADNTLLDDIIADQAASTEATRIDLFDSTIATAKINDATLTKVDNKIDNISSLADAKVFLKKLARYLLND